MLTIREATQQDAAALVAIYAPYVLKTGITFEYEVPSLEMFEQRIAAVQEKYPYLVAETTDHKIIGYAYASTYNGRAAYDWTAEVSVYIAESARGLGAGKQLYQALESCLIQQNIINSLACITEGNDQSIRFHERLGYQFIGEFKRVGYKFNQWYDIVWMQKVLIEIDTPKPVETFPKITI
ncbi:N-acetyltransferase family protein [Vagococcus vulneris]|uniref:GNAT family N-acetyltransferase n=1 Tax=Vagococcus vulneris TaxID=1977869 RepID=A0A429ZYB6_9ENTE|nr:GNAT family N-acetyltransferase [Vagococcus vulneris]RST98945.1 GNAT family N-acetyltransferase [Vagococcus vulneris]